MLGQRKMLLWSAKHGPERLGQSLLTQITSDDYVEEGSLILATTTRPKLPEVLTGAYTLSNINVHVSDGMKKLKPIIGSIGRWWNLAMTSLRIIWNIPNLKNSSSTSLAIMTTKRSELEDHSINIYI